MNITLFNLKKGILIFLLSFCISAVIAGGLPFFLGRTNSIFTLAAILFFAVPLMYLPVIRKKCLQKALLSFSDEDCRIERPKGETVIRWDEIATYRARPWKSMVGTGFIFDARAKDGHHVKLAVLEKDFMSTAGDIRKDSVLLQLCRHIMDFNRTKASELDRITLQPGFLLSASGTTLYWILGVLLIFDLLYRATHPAIGGKHIGFLFLILVLAFMVWGQRRTGRLFFEKLSGCQERMAGNQQTTS